MAAYAWLLSSIINAIIRTFHEALNPESFLPNSLYWSSILIDTLLIAGIFELLRWLRASAPVAVVLISIVTISSTRAFSEPLWGVVVAPIYVICALSYVYWRQRSLWASFSVVLLTLAVYNIGPEIRALFLAVPNT